MWWRLKPRKAAVSAPTPGNEHFQRLIDDKILLKLVKHIKPSIRDVLNLTCSCKALWQALSPAHEVWQQLYLENDPLVSDNSDLKKALSKQSYCDQSHQIALKAVGLSQSVWMRCCALMYHKPRLVLVLAGKDPVIIRRLGQPESEATQLMLGINYHLDSWLDDDEKRFQAEFPQVFKLEHGDLVVTQDYKGAGCFTAVPNPEVPGLMLRKNGYDSGGFGILFKAVAPPTFPLFFYCDATLEDKLDKKALLAKQVYWFAYSQLKDKKMFSWGEHQLFDAL